MPSEDAFGSDQEPGFQDINWRDEILQLMFWLGGEGLFEDVAPDDLRRFLETDPGRLEERLEQLVQEGYLDPSSGDGRRYRLNALGIEEGRIGQDHTGWNTRQDVGAARACHPGH